MIRTEDMIFFHFRLVQFSASRLCFPKILFFHVWRFSRGSIFQSSRFWTNIRRYLAGHWWLFANRWLSSDGKNSTLEICQELVDFILNHVLCDSNSKVLVSPSLGWSITTPGYFFVHNYSVLLLSTTEFLVADTRLYTLPCRSVRPSVRPSVRHISELRAVLALPPLPNHPRLSCRVSGLVFLQFLLLALTDFRL